MTHIVHLLTLLGVVGVPALGWFGGQWSGGTTLVVYWFETVAACLLISARIVLQRRWAPRRGHFCYRAPSANRRSGQSASFLTGFVVTGFAFCGAHAVFLAAFIFLLHHNGKDELAQVDWRSVGFGCLAVMAFLTIEFLVDLRSLRRWSFWQIEQLANRGLSRVVVVHLTLIFGLFAIAVTGASNALFGIFVVLKTLAALSSALPQWEPATVPKWLSRIMNRVPNVRPGERFEDFWAKDRTDEVVRRESNELPWVSG
ncbi:MAG: DUF6498-containing protein [Mycobacterium sp.]